MKTVRALLMVAWAALSLVCPRATLAQSNTPPSTTTAPKTTTPTPTIVPNGSDLRQDLRGVPVPVKSLILDFNSLRDKFLVQQHVLQIKLQNATTPEERQQIRDQLQDNRNAFLSELSDFREQLKEQLQEMKGKLNPGELGRIIDAAHDATSTPGHIGHKGHN